MRTPIAPTLALILALTAACDSSTSPVDGRVRFRFELHGQSASQSFVAETSDPDVIAAARAQLSRPVAERTQFPNGPLGRGDGGQNPGWSWHLARDEWRLADNSAEYCDGLPTDIEQDLAQWLDVIGRFCPYAAYVAAEL